MIWRGSAPGKSNNLGDATYGSAIYTSNDNDMRGTFGSAYTSGFGASIFSKHDDNEVSNSAQALGFRA